MYTYSTKQSIEEDEIFDVECKDQKGVLCAVIRFDCTNPDFHKIQVIKNDQFYFQYLIERIKEAGDFLNELVGDDWLEAPKGV